MESTPILDGLNPQQQAAVVHSGGPLVVVAGAGTGKTRVLTHRIAHLIGHEGLPPSSIMAVTFTNKATGEMRRRLGRLVPHAADNIAVSTIHSACVRMLRGDAERIGRSRDFTIYDQRDSTRLWGRIHREFFTAADEFERKRSVRELRGAVSYAKNLGTDPGGYRRELDRPTAGNRSMRPFDRHVLTDRGLRAYRIYQERLEKANAMDFDDLLLHAQALLHEHDDVRLRWQRRFRHILVDEYQDTNVLQHSIVTMLARRHRQITVVGDPDQAIYAFRGANPGIIEDFRAEFSDAATIVLEQNYRSTQNILDASNALRNRYPHRRPKRLWTNAEDGAPIHIHTAEDSYREAAFVADAIARRHRDDNVPLEEMAVLSRMDRQSIYLQSQLRQRQIPFVVVGAKSFYHQDEIRDALSLLKAATNPADDINARRAFRIAHPRQAPDVFRLADADLAGGDMTFHQWMRSSREVMAPEYAARTVAQFLDLIDSVAQPDLDTHDRLKKLIIDSGYQSRFQARGDEEAEKCVQSLWALLIEAGQYRDAGEFLAHVATADAADSDPDTAAVRLMTVHAAKGLEYCDVYVIGMEDGILPHSRYKESPGGLGEEVCIAYVAMTRARQTLTLSHALTLDVRSAEPRPNTPSRFLSSVPRRIRHESGEARPAFGARPDGRGRRAGGRLPRR